MERLDACYFCGTAADAPLREVTISPRQRQDDPDATVQVTLCPSCEDKLERVLGGLFDHVESRRTEAEAAIEPETELDEADEADEPDEAVAPDEASGADTVDRIDVASGDGDGERRGRRRLFTESPSADEATEASGGDESAATAEAEGGDDDPADDDAEIVDDDEPRVRARATANNPEAIEGVSVAEYNRVMRLLHNRDFPMARTAFVDLVASAYDLGEDTVEAVLDAVIEGGSLAEREGQLVRDDEESP